MYKARNSILPHNSGKILTHLGHGIARVNCRTVPAIRGQLATLVVSTSNGVLRHVLSQDMVFYDLVLVPVCLAKSHIRSI